jgi:glycosyltransferase involved in cell wall biosynthesis
MRILQVTSRYYPYFGGLEEHVKNISERIAKNHNVTVATTDPTGKLPKEESINGVQVLRFKSWAPGEAYYFSRKLQAFLKENSDNFDLVHAHNYHAFPALYAAQTKANNKLVVTPHYHGTGHSFLRNLLHLPYRYFGKEIYEAANQVICVSNYERDLLLKHFKINPDKTHVVPNGVNVCDFQGVTKHKKAYRTILFVGRLEKYKGVQNIIQALPLIDEDIILKVVGKGPFETDLVKLCSQLRLDSRVIFLKDLTRSELVQEYVDADLFVLLSEHESYGICVAEALAARTPCIVADASALSEWIDNSNVFGISYPIHINELVSRMNKVIGKTVDKRELIDWDNVTQKILTLYKSA